MEEEEEKIQIKSPSPANGFGFRLGRSSPSSSTQPVTVATPPPPPPPQQQQSILTLALPIQQPRPPAGSGGGREDCWSDGATSTLIEAWGERYVELSRGNLKQQHWKEVAEIVTSREDYTKPPKTDVQCKNRIDTLKKKYKAEKAKIASGQGDSKWSFFHRLDHLIGANNTKALPNPRIPVAIPVYKQYSNTPPSPDSTDSLPPETVSRKKPRQGDSIKELSRAIVEFAEVYEQMETTKLQQELEMEKERMAFAKEVETQRMELFMKTQLDLLQLTHGGRIDSSNQQKKKKKSNETD